MVVFTKNHILENEDFEPVLYGIRNPNERRNRTTLEIRQKQDLRRRENEEREGGRKSRRGWGEKCVENGKSKM